MSTFNTPIDWATCSAERQAELLMRPAIAASDSITGASWWEYRQSAACRYRFGVGSAWRILVLICDELKHLSNIRRLPRWPPRLPFPLLHVNIGKRDATNLLKY